MIAVRVTNLRRVAAKDLLALFTVIVGERTGDRFEGALELHGVALKPSTGGPHWIQPPSTVRKHGNRVVKKRDGSPIRTYPFDFHGRDIGDHSPLTDLAAAMKKEIIRQAIALYDGT